jgi:hypothetical protein
MTDTQEVQEAAGTSQLAALRLKIANPFKRKIINHHQPAGSSGSSGSNSNQPSSSQSTVKSHLDHLNPEESTVDTEEEIDEVVRKINAVGSIDSPVNSPAKKKKKRKKKHSGADANADVSGENNLQTMIDSALQKSMNKLLPTLVKAVSDVVSSTMEKKLSHIERKLENLHEELQREKVKNKIEQEKQEQFSRRDNLIIQGIAETDTETKDDLVDRVVDLCEILRIKVAKEAIGDIHRIGKKSDKARPVVVKSNRIVKSKIMGAKKILKYNDQLKANPKFGEWVSIYEDMTETKRKLMKAVKDNPNVDYCFGRDGVIRCKKKDGTFINIESADDLFHLGFNDIDYSEYYNFQ